jgi:hypothetical protein
MGKKSNPSIGWEIPTRSQWLESRSGTEHEWGSRTAEPSPSSRYIPLNFAILFS